MISHKYSKPKYSNQQIYPSSAKKHYFSFDEVRRIYKVCDDFNIRLRWYQKIRLFFIGIIPNKLFKKYYDFKHFKVIKPFRIKWYDIIRNKKKCNKKE